MAYMKSWIQGLPYGLTHHMVRRTTWSVLPQGIGKTMEDQCLPDGIVCRTAWLVQVNSWRVLDFMFTGQRIFSSWRRIKTPSDHSC
jgi:hypothetical protein